MSQFPTLLLPLAILAVAFICCILFWKNGRVQVIIAVVATSLLLISSIVLISSVMNSGIQVVHIGNLPPAFAINLVADTLASVMVLITSVIGLAVCIYSISDISVERKRNGFYPVFLMLLFGVCGSFLTGDIFNLYVWFEIMLVASFVLMVLGNDIAQLEGSVKYVILNFISSGFILTGIGIIYNLTGSLNMAELPGLMASHPDQHLFIIPSVFFFIGIGIKAGLFPLFSWLPASYPTPPMSISALMAGLLTKVGVYVFIRFYTLIFTNNPDVTQPFLLTMAGLTMIVGVMGALAQIDLRKILSFHIISQIGYMVMGLALFTPLGIGGAVFYMIHHILVKSNLFLICGIIKKTHGTYSINQLGGVISFPIVTILFVISAFSLAGVPPLSGFWAKFILAKAGLETAHYVIVSVSLLVGFLTLFSMTKIWNAVFWTPPPDTGISETSGSARSFLRSNYLMILPSALLAILTLLISFYPDSLMHVSTRAAEELLNPDSYIQAVLNK